MYLCENELIRYIKQLLIALICACFLVACGSLPKPFKVTSDTSVSLLGAIIEAQPVVAVGPILGFDTRTSKEINVYLRETFSSHGVIVQSQRSQSSSFTITVILDSHGMVIWQLLDSDRVVVLRFAEQPFVSNARVVNGVNLVVKRIAEFLSRYSGTGDYQSPTIAVMPIDGGLADEGSSLLIAMQRELSFRGYQSFASVFNAEYILLGSIIVADLNTIERELVIYIDWTVILPDGTRLGVVTQKNIISRRDIDEKWGNLAQVIAKNAANGVVQLIERYNSVR